MTWFSISKQSEKIELENLIQIVEHNSIDEANKWLKQNYGKEIMYVQCHYYGETTGLLSHNLYKVTITFRP